MVLSSLKRNSVRYRRTLSYEDHRDGSFDYSSLKPSQVLDLLANHAPSLQQSSRFLTQYKELLSEGFGKSRGEFTVEAMQTSVPRHLKPRIKTLQTLLRLRKLRPAAQPTASPIKPRRLPRMVLSPLPSAGTQEVNRQIGEFERCRKQLILTPVDARGMYKVPSVE